LAGGTSLARLIFWGAVLFAFVMAVLPHPPHVPGAPSDKVQHILAFATLGALSACAYPRASFVTSWLWLSVFGALIEVAQAIPWLHRDSDPLDWIADTAAAGLALAIVAVVRRRSGTS
jgi:VanZ family protein